MSIENLDKADVAEISDGQQLADLIDAELAQEEREQDEQLQAAQQSETTAKTDEAMGIAVTGVQIAAKIAEKKWKCLKFEPQVKLEIAEKAAAVLAKYDCKLPPWLQAYKEEIELGFCLGGVIVGAYLKVQEAKKLDAANDESKEKSESQSDSKQEKKRAWL